MMTRSATQSESTLFINCINTNGQQRQVKKNTVSLMAGTVPIFIPDSALIYAVYNPRRRAR